MSLNFGRSKSPYVLHYFEGDSCAVCGSPGDSCTVCSVLNNLSLLTRIRPRSNESEANFI